MGTMTDGEVLSSMRDDGPLNQIRRLFSSGCGRLEQAEAQRVPPTPIERRRMEFEIAREILTTATTEHQLFAAELIGRLGMDREAMDRSEIPIGNQILKELDRQLGLLGKMIPPLLDALRNAAGIESGEVYELLTETGIIRREPYDPESHGDGPGFGDSEPGEEIWILTELGERFAGKEG